MDHGSILFQEKDILYKKHATIYEKKLGLTIYETKNEIIMKLLASYNSVRSKCHTRGS